MPYAIAVFENTCYTHPVYRILRVFEDAKNADDASKHLWEVATEFHVPIKDLVIVYSD